jgi:hypothetical protein
MSNQDSTALPLVHVWVELAGSAVQPHWSKADEAEISEFRQELTSYLRDLVKSLGLPIDFLIVFKEKTANRPIEVIIDGLHCPVPLNKNDFVHGRDLARFIANAVTEDRENLISGKLLDQMWPSISSGDKAVPDVLDPVRLREVFCALVRRGLSLSRLDAILIKMMQKSSGPVGFGNFEEALRDPEQIRLEILLSAAQAQAMSAVANEKEVISNTERIFAPLLNALRRRLFDELGVILPKVNVRRDKDLHSDEIRFRLNDLILPPEGEVTVGDWELIVARLEQAIRDRAELFVTTYCIDTLRTYSPELVEAVYQKIGIPMLLRILESLLMEGLSIRNLRGICESILAIDSVSRVDQISRIVFLPPITNICPVHQEKPVEALDDNDYLAAVRMSMKGWFTANYTTNGKLYVILLDQQLEQRIARANIEPLTKDERNKLIAALEPEIRTNEDPERRPPILTAGDVRRPLWKLMEREFCRYPVINYMELSADVNVESLVRIGI